ncbi:MAG TPA: hypothetical protein VJM33_17405, partial [Microthrixaceae bacterium]|nr:hypothetical protein [Microthrixaceae bacterium]
QLVADLSSRVSQPPLIATSRPFDTNVPYHPLATLLRRAVDADHRSSDADLYQRVRDELTSVGCDPDELGPDLARVLDLPDDVVGVHDHDHDPASVPRRIADAFLAWWIARAATRPYVLIVEDLHWTDPSTIEVVRALVDRSPIPGLLTVITSRPEGDLSWLESRQETRLVEIADLTPLSGRHATELARYHAGDLELTDLELEQLAGLSDGVPLYVERLLATVRAKGPSPAREWAPADLEGLLTSAFTAEGVDPHLVGMLATVGREFDAPFVAQILRTEVDPVAAQLEDLVHRGLLDRDPGREPPVYAFHHALIRASAYEQQLPSDRRRAHRLVADAIEQGAQPSRLDSAAIAGHLDLGGRPARAIPLYLAAIDAIQAKGAHSESMRMLDRVLELVESLDPSPARDELELRAQVRVALSVTSTSGYGAQRALTALERAHELAGTTGQVDLSVQVLGDVFSFHSVRGDRRRAAEILVEMKALAEATGVDVDVDLLMFEGLLEFGRGHLDVAERSYLGALSEIEGERGPAIKGHLSLPTEPLASAAAMMIPLSWMVGRHDEAQAWIELGLRRCEELGGSKGAFSEGFVRSWITWLHAVAGDLERARLDAEAMVELGRRRGMAMWSGLGEVHRLVALALGAPHDGHTEMLGIMIDAMREMGVSAIAPYFMTQQAVAISAAGGHDEAIARFDDAIALAEANEEAFFQAETLRRRAETVLARDPERSDDAISCLHAAATLARNQHCPVFEVRALVDMLAIDAADPVARGSLEDRRDWIEATAIDQYPEVAIARQLLATATGA